jgi:hypothetical protein
MVYQHRFPPPVPSIGIMTWEQAKHLLEDYLRSLGNSATEDPSKAESDSSDVFAFFIGD